MEYTSTPRMLRIIAIAVAVTGLLSASAHAKTSHAGWPTIDGVLVMNRQDESRPLDGRAGGAVSR